MLAIKLSEINNNQPSLSVENVPIPELKTGQVLVKVEAAPVNPSDVMFLQGRYIFERALPVTPGFIAAGTVTASNAGLIGRYLNGKRVCCGGLQQVTNQTTNISSSSINQGTWAEYIAVNANQCIPLASRISNEAGCNLLANPLTSYALVETAQKSGHKAFVHNAAAGDLGKHIIRLCELKGIPLISVVRDESQMDVLIKNGSVINLNSNSLDFDQQLKALCRKHNASIVFDSVSGSLSARMLKAMPDQSELRVVGRLSNSPISLDGLDNLVGRGHRITGFSLYRWISSQTFLKLLRVSNFLQKQFLTEVEIEVSRRISLKVFTESYVDSFANTTEGKTLICPQL